MRAPSFPPLGLIAALVFLATGASRPALAEELRLGVEGNYTFNSNFFSSAANEQEANSFQFGPAINLSDPEGRFRYDLDFLGQYQVYADQDGVDAWESRLNVRASYDLTERTQIRVANRFRDISNLRFSLQDIEVADTALDPTQDRYLRNGLEVELVHDFTVRTQLRLRGEHQWVDFEENLDRNDSTAFTGRGELRYRLLPTHFVGIGGAYTRQDFEEALSRVGSIGETVNGFLSWTWLIADNITFTANGGPSWVRSNEDDIDRVFQTQFVGGNVNGETRRALRSSCVDEFGAPATARFCLVGQGSSSGDLGDLVAFNNVDTTNNIGTETTFTFFGGASLAATFSDFNLQLSYQRRQSTTTGDGLVSVLDRIFTEVEWAPRNSRSSAFTAFSWDRRDTLTNSTGIDFDLIDGANPDPPPNGGPTAQRDPNGARTFIRDADVTRDNFTFIMGYRYRIQDELAATLDWRFRRTQLSDPDVNEPDIDSFFVVLTFEYDFAPIQF